MAKLTFAKETKNHYINNIKKKSYKVLVVDDEQSVHDVTNMTLSHMNFSDFSIEILNALSAEEAKGILSQHSDIALALIDVVMETPDAGLDLVNYIRDDIKDSLIRLVIRTGQANEFPEMDVIRHFDINDFKNKTELTVEHLFTTVRTSIKQYEQLVALNNKYEETYRQMTTNSLTQLSNRIKLYEDCERESHSNMRTLILIDIVGFSAINEVHGYDTGDFVLKELGGFLQAMYCDSYDVYHLDSDLFALVSQEDYIENIVQTVEAIKHDIAQLHLVTNNFNQTLDSTIGVACQTEDNLIRKAELALKEARSKGKNNIQFYSDDLKIIQKIRDANYWGPIIKEALIDENFLAYFQPIYDLKTDTVAKYELLIRLKYGNNLYLPDQFLPAAKDTGQMYNIFKYMFEKACAKAKETGKFFSVNIGDTEFENENIITFIIDTIKQFNINPEQISLEILEYNSLTGADNIKRKIIEISKIGLKILIDDFGINCSNFGQIENLPVESIKIDGSFIKNLPTSKNSQTIVRSIQTYTRENDIKLVAEYVCTQEILDKVKELNIEFGQGFHLGRPLEDIIL